MKNLFLEITCNKFIWNSLEEQFWFIFPIKMAWFVMLYGLGKKVFGANFWYATNKVFRDLTSFDWKIGHFLMM